MGVHHCVPYLSVEQVRKPTTCSLANRDDRSALALELVALHNAGHIDIVRAFAALNNESSCEQVQVACHLDHGTLVLGLLLDVRGSLSVRSAPETWRVCRTALDAQDVTDCTRG
jgi:hypothetical protein